MSMDGEPKKNIDRPFGKGYYDILSAPDSNTGTQELEASRMVGESAITLKKEASRIRLAEGRRNNRSSAGYCPICRFTFADGNSLQRHLEASENHKPFCTLCKKVFKNQNGLLNHIENAERHENHCKTCVRVFKNVSGLVSHIKAQPGHNYSSLSMPVITQRPAIASSRLTLGSPNRPRKKGPSPRPQLPRSDTGEPASGYCPLCNQTFDDRRALQKHIRHSADHDRFCTVCKMAFAEYGLLASHIEEGHHPFCNLCVRPFTDLAGLRMHLETANGHDYFCPLCHKVLKDLNGLQNHTENASGHEGVCSLCFLLLEDQSTLRTHVEGAQGHHFACTLCYKAFDSESRLQRHIQHTPGHKFHCTLCLKVYHQRNSLSNHVQHALGHEYTCTECLVTYVSHLDLNQHVNRDPVHVYCETCNRSFVNQQARDTHWQTTSQHRHCLQSGCHFDASSTEELQAHVVADHFWCETCEETFPSGKALKAHRHRTLEDSIDTSKVVVKEGMGDYLAEILPEPCSNDLANSFTSMSLSDPGPAYETPANPVPYSPGVSEQATLANLLPSSLVTLVDSCPCWGCAEFYPSVAAMMTHLESGNCFCHSELASFNETLATCYLNPSYMLAPVRKLLLSGIDLGTNLFVCRGCNTSFGTFSGLVGHVESETCTQKLVVLNLAELARYFQARFL